MTDVQVKPEDHPQAGGGGTVDREAASSRFSLSQTWKRYVDEFEKEIQTKYDLKTPEGIQDFLQTEQHASKDDVAGFIADKTNSSEHILENFVSSTYGDLLLPLRDEKDTYCHPLSSYFISSSHNTYLQHSQLIGEASVDVYKDVLLRGCRCVEIDVWNGKGAETPSELEQALDKEASGIRRRMNSITNKLGRLRAGSKGSSDVPSVPADDAEETAPKSVRTPSPLPKSPSRTAREPRVLHGHTLTKEVPFRKVCEAIRDSAFVASELPVVVSLEVHCNMEGQQMMVDIITETWRDFLVTLPQTELDSLDSTVSSLPSPKDLNHKILVKVKYSSPERARARKIAAENGEDAGDNTDGGSATASDVEDDAPEVHPADALTTPVARKKKKGILQPLSSLGIYTRAYHFKSFDQPEAQLSSHVFSLSEGALATAHATVPSKLAAHNRRFLMRCYPKGTRVMSGNMNPAPFWRRGVQMAALNFQSIGKPMMLNEGMFAGSGGYVLKPTATTPHRLLDLRVDLLATQNLPATHKIHPYAVLSLHTEGLEPQRAGAAPAPAQDPKAPRPGPLRRQSSSDVFKSGQPGAVKLKARSAVVRHEHRLLGGKKEGAEAATDLAAEADFKAEQLRFAGVEIDDPALCFLRLKIVDDVELQRDALVAWACVRLDRLGHGLRAWRLFDAKGRVCDGRVLVRVSAEYRPLH